MIVIQHTYVYTVVQRQTTVTASLKNKQLLNYFYIVCLFTAMFKTFFEHTGQV